MVQSFLGGLVDVYKGNILNGYSYDLNSLYPYSMCKAMPVGYPRHIRKVKNIENLFGFINV